MNISKLRPLLYILYLVISSYNLVIQISCARVKVPLWKNSRKEITGEVRRWILCSLPFVGIVELFWFASLFLNCKTVIISIIVLMLPFWCRFHLAIAAAIFFIIRLQAWRLMACKEFDQAKKLILFGMPSGAIRDVWEQPSRLHTMFCLATQSVLLHTWSNMHSGLSLWSCGCCIIQ